MWREEQDTWYEWKYLVPWSVLRAHTLCGHELYCHYMLDTDPRPWMLLTPGCNSWKGRCSFHCLCHRRGHWSNPVKKWPHSTQPPLCPVWPEAQGTASAMEQRQKFSAARGRMVGGSQLYTDAAPEFPGKLKRIQSFLANARPGRCPWFASQTYKMNVGGKTPSAHWSTPVTILKNELIHYYLPSWCSVFSTYLLYGRVSKWIIIFLMPKSVINWRAILCTNSINICWLGE